MKVGFTCGTFDLLHAGHILMLEEAAKQCQYLIVGLQVDPSLDRPGKNRPVQSLQERWIQLQAVRYVDEVRVYSTEKGLEELLLTTPIDIRIVGEDHILDDFTGRHSGVEIYFNSRNHDYSTTELRERVVAANEGETK